MSKSNFSLDELVRNNSFKAWTEGHASLSEKRFWDNWVQESAENRHLALKAQKEITRFSFNPMTAPDTPEAWRKISREMEHKPQFHSFPRSQKHSGKWVYAAAAGILILLTVGLTYLVTNPGIPENTVQYAQERVITDYGERKKITLSDGSSIVLNANSALTYTPRQTMKQGVNIRLEGEAYFTVAERNQPDDAPFTVSTPDGRVSVLGTQFAVSTRNRHTRVVLEEGKVVIDQREVIPGSDKESALKPGEMATFSRSSEAINIDQVNTEVYTSWTTNTLTFDHTPLAEIKDRLEYTFGVHIVVRDSDLYQRVVSGSIENAGLPVITSALSRALKIPFILSGDTIYIGKKDDPAESE